ncbi:hypothetical protein GNZ13_22985 [Paraburkholderia sp. 5N]|uniref:Uncharacterized protein n=1 Tax=Paraburkholderia elongata TaxID=2675747 RepID=A0A972SIV6_9BURK|nr:hypothetical protein [Paraburkholderia elongata]
MAAEGYCTNVEVRCTRGGSRADVMRRGCHHKRHCPNQKETKYQCVADV